jgi:Ca-activated chloride channel family protein
MTDRALRSLAAPRVFGVIALFAFLVLLWSQASAQTSANVHIIPDDPTTRDAVKRKPGEPLKTEPVSDIRTSVMRVRVELVMVPVTVRDGMNRPVMGLAKDNFLVYEDNAPQSIRYFSSEDAPISIGILLDVSGTMRNKIDATREALAEFFKNSHPDDDYFVITFADRPTLLADSTKSIGGIQERLVAVKPYGYTALLDAIQMGVEKLRSAHYQRRALLIISDGGDNSSHHKMRDVKNLVEESGVEVYALGLFDDGLPLVKSLEEKFGEHLLSQIAEAGGGRMITVANLARLPEIARELSEEMRSQYLLGYRPSTAAHDGGWRKIKVRVARSIAASDNSSRLHPAYKKGYAVPRD